MSRRLTQALAVLGAELRWSERRGLGFRRGARWDWVQRADAPSFLRTYVYERHFAQWRPQPGQSAQPYGTEPAGHPAFVAELYAATGGASYWDPGWRITHAAEDWAFASNGAIQLFLDGPEDWRCARRDPSPLRVHEEVSVRIPCARENLAPGFFYMVGRAGRMRRDRPFIKFYLNLAPGGAVALVRTLLVDAGLEGTPFEAKVPNHPAAFCRVDSGVIYAERDAAPAVSEALLRLRRELVGCWGRSTPLFTQPLAPGVAAAESPAELAGQVVLSYGEHRSFLLAEVVLGALEAGELPGRAWSARLRQRLQQEGIRWRSPYAQTLGAAWPLG